MQQVDNTIECSIIR